MVCPYEAPYLIDKEVDGQMDRFSAVDSNKCMGCGTCVAACPLGAIARPGVGNEEVRAQIDIAKSNGDPTLAVFVCDWSLRAADDVSLLESYPANVRVIHIPCTGRIDPEMALLALRSGIDGVLICGCAPGECHYKRGTDVGSCKIGLLNRMFGQMGVGNGRVRFIQVGTQDRGRIRSEVDGMVEHLAAAKEAM
jgi:heterodisulfide reductase subunit A